MVWKERGSVFREHVAVTLVLIKQRKRVREDMGRVFEDLQLTTGLPYIPTGSSLRPFGRSLPTYSTIYST